MMNRLKEVIEAIKKNLKYVSIVNESHDTIPKISNEKNGFQNRRAL